MHVACVLWANDFFFQRSWRGQLNQSVLYHFQDVGVERITLLFQQSFNKERDLPGHIVHDTESRIV